MSKKLSEALEHLHEILREESSNDCVSVEIFINCVGINIKYEICSPKDLKKKGASMRNLRGEWVEVKS